MNQRDQKKRAHFPIFKIRQGRPPPLHPSPRQLRVCPVSGFDSHVCLGSWVPPLGSQISGPTFRVLGLTYDMGPFSMKPADYEHVFMSILYVSQYPVFLITRYSQGKTVFYSVQYKNGCLAASGLFHIFTQSIKFYIFHYHVLRVQMFEKCDSSNRQ